MSNINKHAILISFKKTGQKVLFSSVKQFCEHYPEYSRQTIYNYTGRKKQAFEDNNIIVEKIPYFKKIDST